METIKKILPSYFKVEVFNCVTHGVMAFLFLILLAPVTIFSYQKGGYIRAYSVSVFVICIFLMFLISTLYHAMLHDSSHKQVFRILDHIFIYFAIAGTYTPVALCLMKGYPAIIILIIQWTMVLVGIFYKAFAIKKLPKLSLVIYLVMGWTALLFIPDLITQASTLFLGYIIAGGVMYSIGAFFYAKKDFVYGHVIWHVFIALASIMHLIAIVFYM